MIEIAAERLPAASFVHCSFCLYGEFKAEQKSLWHSICVSGKNDADEKWTETSQTVSVVDGKVEFLDMKQYFDKSF